MSKNFFDHLHELRTRLISSLVALLFGGGICFYFSDEILNFISHPISPYLDESQGRLIFTSPMDEFLAHIKITIFGAFMVTFPYLFYQFWSFLSPGLYKNEKKVIAFFVSFSSILFLAGNLFIYFVVYPLAFKFLLNFGSSVALISIKDYLSFFIQTSLAFGILFEIPLVLVGSVWMGILNVSQLKKGRPYAVIFLATLCAFVTPPDVLSMILLLIPLYLLYEISILISQVFKLSKD